MGNGKRAEKFWPQKNGHADFPCIILSAERGF